VILIYDYYYHYLGLILQ